MITLNPTLRRKMNRWMPRVLAGVVIVLLSYGGLYSFNAWKFPNRGGRPADQQSRSKQVPTVAMPVRMAPGEMIGRIQILRLGVSVIVIEGANEDALRHAAGHIPGTALPGHAGNIGISAHRDTFFRPLRNILPDDIITLATPLVDYRYRVVSTAIAKSEDIPPSKAAEGEVLTLVTCYPFDFVGSAPKRFIVRAERIT